MPQAAEQAAEKAADTPPDHASAFAPVRFNTADVPAAERMAYVRDFYGPVLIGLDLVPSSGDPFHISGHFLNLPGVLVGQGHTSAIVSSRTTALLSDGIDDLTICRSERAYRVTTPDGREMELGAGETGVWNLGQRSSADIQSSTTFRTVQVSRARLRTLVPNIDDLDMLRFAAGDPALDLMFGYAELLERQHVGSEEGGRLVAAQLAELAALAFKRSAPPREAPGRSAVKAARLATAKAATLAALHRHDLSATTIGTQLGISARYVQVLFEEGGETFSAYVARLRMEWLRRMLDDPRHAHRRISDLAFEAGFRDLSTFNRQFRRHFGEAPSAARRREVP